MTAQTKTNFVKSIQKVCNVITQVIEFWYKENLIFICLIWYNNTTYWAFAQLLLANRVQLVNWMIDESFKKSTQFTKR